MGHVPPSGARFRRLPPPPPQRRALALFGNVSRGVGIIIGATMATIATAAIGAITIPPCKPTPENPDVVVGCVTIHGPAANARRSLQGGRKEHASRRWHLVKKGYAGT